MIERRIVYQDKTSSTNISFDFLDDLLQLDCFHIVDQNADLRDFDNSELQKWLEFEEFLIIGTGGSYLGAKCIYEISKSLKVSQKCIYFLNNLDPYTIKRVFSKVKNPNKLGVLCVSKSGETLETISLLSVVIDFFHLKELNKQIVVITEDKLSTLKQIATEKNLICIDHPKTIGGRFSVFSVVGMLPALICGVLPQEIRSGAAEILHSDMEAVKRNISFIFQGIKLGFTNHVSFIYSDKLISFSEWLAQLYAESSGKEGAGVTPITARGAVDQHSQLQLYLDGPHDKVFTFFIEKQNDDLQINENIDHIIPSASQKFDYLQGKRVFDIFEAQCNATISTLAEKKYNVREFVLPEITPKILGALFMHFMIEVSCICKLLKVDPYNQPAVERGKIITKEILSRIRQASIFTNQKSA